ncbi:alanine:cation symporter family protein [Pyramidobacter piscolens]|uniref:alanine:cation symporter family protein n=1 Tax=Pyramidobacter piscolens TaxID=638849 RepID=UPI002445F402|nr:alanine:cation symporter family protein [Pyramidobacter piscolens]
MERRFDGIALTISAFDTLYGKFGAWIVSISVMLAALTTMIGYYFEYKTSVVYVFGEKNMGIFNVFWLIPPFVAVTQDVDLVWTIVDISTGIEGIPNMIAMLALAPIFFKVYKQWTKDNNL